MALSLTAEQKSIFDIFSGKEQYIIPPYQRPYAWGRKHCRVLFEDLTNAYFENKDEGYFLGNIVISQNRQNRNSLEVIDGQQRLTTLLLLIKALLQFDKDNIDLKNAIDIPSSRRDEETKPRLRTTVFMEKDNNYFNEALSLNLTKESCEAAEESRFKKNICYFYKSIKELSTRNNIQSFIDFFMFDVYLLPIVTEGDNPDKARKKALKIFETINDRGLNLSTSDILKAKIYSIALNELKHNDFIEKWKLIEMSCNDFNKEIDYLFTVYALIHGGGYSVCRKDYLREFFLERKESPLYTKGYSEIIKDILKITRSVKEIKKILSSKKENEDKKLFQILTLANKDYTKLVVIFIYKNENKNNLSFFLRELIKTTLYYDNMRGQVKSSENKIYYKNRYIIYEKIIKLINENKKIKMTDLLDKSYLSKKYDVLRDSGFSIRSKVMCFIFLYIHLKYRNHEVPYPNYNYIIKFDDKEENIQRSVFRNLGRFVVTDFLPETNESLKKSSVLDTKKIAYEISGKTDEEIKNIISKRTEDIAVTINKFMNN